MKYFCCQPLVTKLSIRLSGKRELSCVLVKTETLVITLDSHFLEVSLIKVRRNKENKTSSLERTFVVLIKIHRSKSDLSLFFVILSKCRANDKINNTGCSPCRYQDSIGIRLRDVCSCGILTNQLISTEIIVCYMRDSGSILESNAPFKSPSCII